MTETLTATAQTTFADPKAPPVHLGEPPSHEALPPTDELLLSGLDHPRLRLRCSIALKVRRTREAVVLSWDETHLTSAGDMLSAAVRSMQREIASAFEQDPERFREFVARRDLRMDP